MRVEQRIGRIDRNGQKSESIAIINLITPDTLDADIYERCLVRIGVFNNALGGGEEILGEITREIRSIAENYQLNADERKQRFQQLADNKIRLVQEQEDLEQQQAELFGIRLPQDQMNREIAEAASFWLSPTALQRLVNLYLQSVCEKDQDLIAGEKPLKTVRIAQEYRNRLLRDLHQLPRQNTSVYRDWENWLRGGNPHLSITFESDCAIQHPEATFVMPLHPLVKQAAQSFDSTQQILTHLAVESNHVEPGRYEFAIYQWRFRGIRDNLVLKPFARCSALNDHLESLLKKAVDRSERLAIGLDAPVWQELDDQHYALWKDAINVHKRDTQTMAEYRRQSLSTSHRARLALLHEQLAQTTDEKIHRMRNSQIAAAEADYARRNEDIDSAIAAADIIASSVAYGVIHVSGGSSNAD
jgi:hypothetical protein